MDVVGAILVGWTLAGVSVVVLLNMVKLSVQIRSLQPPRRALSASRRRKVEPALERHPSAGRRAAPASLS